MLILTSVRSSRDEQERRAARGEISKERVKKIRFEMSIFGAAMKYAAKKKYITASQRFEGKPKLKTMRRDEFSLEEYRIGRE